MIIIIYTYGVIFYFGRCTKFLNNLLFDIIISVTTFDNFSRHFCFQQRLIFTISVLLRINAVTDLL